MGGGSSFQRLLLRRKLTTRTRNRGDGGGKGDGGAVVAPWLEITMDGDFLER